MDKTTTLPDDLRYTVADTHNDIAHVLDDLRVPYDDDFYVTICVTHDKSLTPIDATAQYTHVDNDDVPDMDVTYLMDMDSVIAYLKDARMDYTDIKSDTTMYQKKLYTCDFIADIMIARAFLHDDVETLTNVKRELYSDDAKSVVDDAIAYLKTIRP